MGLNKSTVLICFSIFDYRLLTIYIYTISQLRKSVSLRSDTDVTSQTPTSAGPTAVHSNEATPSAYALPGGYATSSTATTQPSHQAMLPQHAMQYPSAASMGATNGNTISNSNSNRCHTMPAKLLQAPPIPDPDYSLSESDGETENSILLAHNTKMNAQIGGPPSNENSGNNSHNRFVFQ